MSRPYFYYATTKKIIVAVATIFDEITMETDHGDIITVPLIFSQREKYIDDIAKSLNLNGEQFDQDALKYNVVMPCMGLELSGLNFAPERHTNPIHEIVDYEGDDNQEISMYNRVAYDVTFDLHIAANKIEDSLKIVEQIIPYFTPELTLTYFDKKDFKLETNLTVVLNSVAVSIEYEGSIASKRTIEWTLNLTCKAFYYQASKNTDVIKQTVMDLTDMEFDTKFERLTSTVVPFDASEFDEYKVIDEIIEGSKLNDE